MDLLAGRYTASEAYLEWEIKKMRNEASIYRWWCLLTLRILICFASNDPVSPAPVRTWKTPLGKPAASKSGAIASEPKGLCSEGFRINTFPVARQGAAFMKRVAMGALNGFIPAHTLLLSVLILVAFHSQTQTLMALVEQVSRIRHQLENNLREAYQSTRLLLRLAKLSLLDCSLADYQP